MNKINSDSGIERFEDEWKEYDKEFRNEWDYDI
jgi:hypothetical protein